MRTRSVTFAAAGLLLAATALAGCSSSDDAPDASPAGSGAAASSTASASASLVPVKPGAAAFCEVLQKQTALSTQGALSDLKGDALTSYIAQAKQLNDDLVAASPAEIKKDVELTIQISTMAQEAAVDPSKRAAVIQRSTQSDVQEANARLSSYAGEACQLSAASAASSASGTAGS